MAFICIGIGFTIGIIIKILSGEGKLSVEAKVEANRLRAVKAVRSGEKAVRKMQRSNRKVQRAQQIGSPELTDSAMRDLKDALKTMRWAMKELDVVIGRIKKGLPFPEHAMEDILTRRQALENMA
ncbi:unnamed protein product, partial [marine sediment metagenome]